MKEYIAEAKISKLAASLSPEGTRSENIIKDLACDLIYRMTKEEILELFNCEYMSRDSFSNIKTEDNKILDKTNGRKCDYYKLSTK